MKNNITISYFYNKVIFFMAAFLLSSLFMLGLGCGLAPSLWAAKGTTVAPVAVNPVSGIHHNNGTGIGTMQYRPVRDVFKSVPVSQDQRDAALRTLGGMSKQVQDIRKHLDDANTSAYAGVQLSDAAHHNPERKSEFVATNWKGKLRKFWKENTEDSPKPYRGILYKKVQYEKLSEPMKNSATAARTTRKFYQKFDREFKTLEKDINTMTKEMSNTTEMRNKKGYDREKLANKVDGIVERMNDEKKNLGIVYKVAIGEYDKDKSKFGLGLSHEKAKNVPPSKIQHHFAMANDRLQTAGEKAGALQGHLDELRQWNREVFPRKRINLLRYPGKERKPKKHLPIGQVRLLLCPRKEREHKGRLPIGQARLLLCLRKEREHKECLPIGQVSPPLFMEKQGVRRKGHKKEKPKATVLRLR